NRNAAGGNGPYIPTHLILYGPLNDHLGELAEELTRTTRLAYRSPRQYRLNILCRWYHGLQSGDPQKNIAPGSLRNDDLTATRPRNRTEIAFNKYHQWLDFRGALQKL